MLPLAQPGIITVTIFNFITIWNEFFMSMLFASKQKVRPIAVGLYNMVKGMQYTNDYGGMFAAVMIVFLPTLLLYVFLSEKKMMVSELACIGSTVELQRSSSDTF